MTFMKKNPRKSADNDKRAGKNQIWYKKSI